MVVARCVQVHRPTSPFMGRLVGGVPDAWNNPHGRTVPPTLSRARCDPVLHGGPAGPARYGPLENHKPGRTIESKPPASRQRSVCAQVLAGPHAGESARRRAPRVAKTSGTERVGFYHANSSPRCPPHRRYVIGKAARAPFRRRDLIEIRDPPRSQSPTPSKSRRSEIRIADGYSASSAHERSGEEDPMTLRRRQHALFLTLPARCSS